MFIKKFVLLTVIIILISCAGPADPNNTEGEVIISTIKTGSILQSGQTLPVSLIYDESSDEFDYLIVTLFSDDGIQISQNKIEKSSFDKNRKKEISFPEDLEKGIYHIKLVIMHQDSSISSSTVSFFHSEGEYRITSLKTYPPDPAPDEKVFLLADFKAPPGADPFFRWTLSGNTVYEGLLSQAGNRFTWKIPSRAGVFPFSVEMFPYPPSEKSFVKFFSSLNSESVIFASESNKNKAGRLGPEESYITLFDFRGEIVNRGYAAGSPAGNGLENIQVSGKPVFDFNDGIYGYSFNRSDSVILPYISTPFTNQKQLAYSTVNFKFLPDYTAMADNNQINEPGVFFNTASEDGSFSLTLGMRGRGDYFLTLSDSSQTYTSSAYDSISGDRDIINLSVSLYPDNSTTLIVWIVNGNAVRRDRAPFRPVLRESAGSTFLGSMGRFSALIAEAGVYARNEKGENSCDPFVFRNYHTETSGRNLVLAEGFEIPLNSMTMAVSGNPLFREGLAYLNPGDRLLLNNNAPLNELSYPVEISVNGQCDIIIEDQNGNELFNKSFEGHESAVFMPAPDKKYNIYASNEGSGAQKIIESILILRYTGNAAAENDISSM